MKKLSVALLFISAIAVSACHYGRTEAEKTLERNEQYKGDKQDFSVNRAGEGGKLHSSDAPADTTVAAAHDSTAAGSK